MSTPFAAMAERRASGAHFNSKTRSGNFFFSLVSSWFLEKFRGWPLIDKHTYPQTAIEAVTRLEQQDSSEAA